MNLGTGNLSTVGNVAPDGTAARDMTLGRASSGAGNTLAIQAGGAQSGGIDLFGRTLIVSSGISVGNNGSNIDFYTAADGSGAGTTDRTPAIKMRVASSGQGRLIIGNNTGQSIDGITMVGNVARTVQSGRHTTSNTASNSLTIQSGSATSGATDKAAGDLILKSAISTGTAGANVRIQTMTRATATGTSDNTAVDRIIAQSPKSVTNNSATTVATLTIASGTVVAGVLSYAVEVTNGTNCQTEVGTIAYSATNASGTFANNTVTKYGNQQSVTSGTLTVTWTLTTAGLLQINANSSLTPSTGYPRVTFVLENLT